MFNIPKINRVLFFSVIGFILLVWTTFMGLNQSFNLFGSNWPMSLTMMVGSFIAGATSEGGGAVAFPVMTLLFKIEPQLARDFSLMIQSIGMVVASLAIVLFKIKIEKRVLLYSTFGGALGITCGLIFLNGKLPPSYTKMFFTSFWLSFCFVLFKKRGVKVEGQVSSLLVGRTSFRVSLICLGILGGMFSSILGTGLDIITFSFLVLYAGLDPKVATPTSVILMGLNSAVGFIVRYFFVMPEIPEQVWSYWLVCIPVVIIGAPLGALYISDKSKDFIERILIFSIGAQFFFSLIIIKQTPALMVFSGITFILGLVLFNSFKKTTQSTIEL